MWKIGDVRLYVQNFNVNSKNIIARLQPLAGGTIHHIFGYEDNIIRLDGYVVGSSAFNTLQSYAKSNNTVIFITPYFSGSNYLVNNVEGRIIPSVCQTIDKTLPIDAPIYIVNVELYED